MTAGEPTTGWDDEACPEPLCTTTLRHHTHTDADGRSWCCQPYPYAAPAAVADNAGGYDGPVIGLDGLPVPCQIPGCSRRAATKALCTRHRGLPRPAASPGGQADDECSSYCRPMSEELRHELAAVMERGGSDVLEVADAMIAGPLAPLLAAAEVLTRRAETAERALSIARRGWDHAAAATTGRGDDGAVQRVLEACDELKEDAKLAKRLADEARTRGDRELQRINIRHARVASHAASAIRGAVAGGQDGASC